MPVPEREEDHCPLPCCSGQPTAAALRAHTTNQNDDFSLPRVKCGVSLIQTRRSAPQKPQMQEHSRCGCRMYAAHVPCQSSQCHSSGGREKGLQCSVKWTGCRGLTGMYPSPPPIAKCNRGMLQELTGAPNAQPLGGRCVSVRHVCRPLKNRPIPLSPTPSLGNIRCWIQALRVHVILIQAEGLKD